MKKIIAIIASILGFSGSVGQTQAAAYELNYDKMIILDAESLAEQGIKDAYEEINTILKKYKDKPDEIYEMFDHDTPSYTVICNGQFYEIYGPDLPEGEGQSWGRATYAFFTIVNNQIKNQNIKFYAINGGNDLGGIFLTEEEYQRAINSLERKTDWPYIPTMEHPWYGQNH